MPRPSRSNFTSPAAAQSSLSHCSTVRPCMRAHSTGHTSITGRSHSTMPPEWMPRWRGACSTCERPARAAGRGCRRRRAGPRPFVGSARSGTAAARRRLRPPGPSGRPAWPRRRPGRGRSRGPWPCRAPRTGPVGDDVGDLGGVVAPVALVDVLDDLLAPARLDVDVDVGGPVALGRQEPLEQQAEGDGVGLGDAEGEAHRRVGRRAPPLAVDVLRRRQNSTRSHTMRK